MTWLYITQVESGAVQHLENISQLQLYEYQFDENLCCNVPSAVPFDLNVDSLGCTDEEDPLLRASKTIKASKDRARGDMKARNYHEKDVGGRSDVAAVRRQVGLLAQEVEQVLPNAVKVTVSCVCVCAFVCVCMCVCVYLCVCVY